MCNSNYQICSNCIMDTSDKTLTFDDRGWCDYCRNFETNIAPNWQPGDVSIEAISPYIDKIKKEGADKDFLESKIVSGNIYMSNILPQVQNLSKIIIEGDDDILSMKVNWL